MKAQARAKTCHSGNVHDRAAHKAIGRGTPKGNQVVPVNGQETGLVDISRTRHDDGRRAKQPGTRIGQRVIGMFIVGQGTSMAAAQTTDGDGIISRKEQRHGTGKHFSGTFNFLFHDTLDDMASSSHGSTDKRAKSSRNDVVKATRVNAGQGNQ